MKWKNNAQSPVLFFIDDLSNSVIDRKQENHGYLENDYGYYLNKPCSAFRFLEDKILADFPEIKTTFFVVTGKFNPDITDAQDHRWSQPMDFSKDSKSFFKFLEKEQRFELAYHGMFHNLAGKTIQEFVPEWVSFTNIDQAISSIQKGKEIYKNAIGYYPRGGKYPAYRSNEFSDESIDQTGFQWWCRYDNRGLIEGYWKRPYNLDKTNPLVEFDTKFFGQNKVLDIPSTLPGNLFNRVLHPSRGIKGMIKKALKPILIKRLYRKIDFLLENNLIISIQDHISPCRLDGTRQTPNIFDDVESLHYIFQYLKGKKVWYCTGSELAEWVLGRTHAGNK
jgi:hypothetical protein